MHVTQAQIETLLTKFPKDELDGWNVERTEFVPYYDMLRVSIGTTLEESYVRYVTREGGILRWDEDENRWLPATSTPEEGSYRRTEDDTVRVYRY